MKITLKSPAAGHSAGDTANIDAEYARWLVEQGYAVEAEDKTTSSASTTTEDASASSSSSSGKHRRTKRTAGDVTERDCDAE